jgi:hypothetical protein
LYDDKYFDKYSSNSIPISYNNRILGDATGELGPFYKEVNPNYYNNWYDDMSFFIDDIYPWFRRGGCFNNGFRSGQLTFRRYTGDGDLDIGFRLVLAN